MFYQKLKNYCFSYVKSAEAAEELVSDVFIKIWQIRNKLTDISNLKMYLYTIARNCSLNYITKNFKHPATSLDTLDFEPVLSFGTPEELCISADLVEQIRQRIRLLPSQCRIIFQMVKEDGFSYKEVAEHLNISVLTVRNQVFIATKKIAELLPAYIFAADDKLMLKR
ncbi:MAG: RNA polymerase sigma-70 factor [Bacteroidetes bacterium]|nr:RNA polymerase sigma-70 factor [Bacteroidota bacterium]